MGIAKTVFAAFDSMLPRSMATTSKSLHASNPELARLLGIESDRTKAGVSIDHETVMCLPAVMRGVSIVASTVAAVPFQVVKNLDNKNLTNYEPDMLHPSWGVVTDKPNKEITIDVFRETMTAWAMLWGNAVAYIDRPKWPYRGKIEMTPLLPDRTELIRITPGFAEKTGMDPSFIGQLYYKTWIDDKEWSFHADNCLHIRGLGSNPYWGYDIVTVLMETFGSAAALKEFGARFFGQGGNPAGFIEVPDSMSEEAQERFRLSIQRGSEGLGRAHRFMLLEEDAKFKQWTVDPQKAQFLEGKRFDIREIAMAVGIKVHKLVDVDSNAYASLTESNREHKDDDIVPWLRRWRYQMADKLLTEEQRRLRKNQIVFDRSEIEYIPYEQRVNGVVNLCNNGLLTQDEGRRQLDQGPSTSENAGRYRMPVNIAWEDEPRAAAGSQNPAAVPGEETEPEDETEETEDEETTATASIKFDEVEEMRLNYLRRESKRIVNIAQAKATKGDNGKSFLDWVDNLEAPEDAPALVADEVQSMYEACKTELQEIAATAEPDSLAQAVKDWSVLDPALAK